ncbi:hypothetical protein Goari_024420, partial [Gossypium aridum]|nr:hypothetical protein [Gossypium aridum]
YPENKNGKTDAKRKVTSLSSILPAQEAQKVAKRVPFVKSAVFPGRLVHTNEFLVLLGESYYVERTAKQTNEILKRRGKEGLVELREEDEEENTTEPVSQLGRAKMICQLLDSKLILHTNLIAAPVACATCCITCSYTFRFFIAKVFLIMQPTYLMNQGCPTFAEENKLMGAPEDDEYARIMSRLEELEKELAAKSYGENEKWDTNAAESDGEED